MDKEYIERLKVMLADADAKIASVEDIQDPTERDIKRSMFVESRKEIEALLKKAGGSVKKTPAKKATIKKSVSTKKKAAKKPAKAKAKKAVAKKAKPATKKVIKKPAKKAAKKPAKKVVKKAVAKRKVSKPTVKKATTKKPTKKVTKTKKPVAKKNTKKVTKTKKATSKDVTVKEFTKKPKKKVVAKKAAKPNTASTSDDAKAVFSNASKKELKADAKKSVKEKKTSKAKQKAANKSAKKANAAKKTVKKTTVSKKQAKADMNADANIYMKPKKTSIPKTSQSDEDAVVAFGNDKNESKIDNKEIKTTEKEYKKAEKFEKKEGEPTNSSSSISSKSTVITSDEKDAIKEAKKREKEAKKLAKRQAKEYKKQSKAAEKELAKTEKVNGYEIPEYSDEISKVRSTSVPQFEQSHPAMTDKELALNTIYASLFYADPDADVEKQFANHKPISVGSYDDSNYEGAIQPYKDTKNTPTAKVGVEAGPLTNGPVAIPTDAADAVNPNGNPTVIPAEKAKPVVNKESTKDQSVKSAEEIKQSETKVEEAKSVQAKSEPLEPAKPTASEKEAIKAAEKKAKEKAKAEKAAEKEYKKAEKSAKKEMKKPNKVNGYEIPEYSDDISKIRNKNVPEFGDAHPAMTNEQLILNTQYASLFYADPDADAEKQFANHKPISVGSYDDSNYEGAIQPYKDTKNTPTAKVGVEAGPLTNGPVAIPTDAADAENPNNPTDTASVEEAKPVGDNKSAKEAEKAAKKQQKEKAIEAKKQAKLDKEKSEEIAKVNAQAGATATEQNTQSEPTVDPKEAKKREKAAKKQAKAQAKLAKKQQKEAMERETEMRRKQEEDKLILAKKQADETAAKQKAEEEKQKDKEAEINRLAAEASAKAAKQQKEEAEKSAKAEKKAAKNKKAETESKHDVAIDAKDAKENAENAAKGKRAEIKKGEFIKIDLPPIPDEGVKSLKQIAKRQKQLTSKYSKQILEGAIVTTTDYKPDVSKHVIELHDVVKSYITGDIETPVLKGVDLKLNKGDFIVILGPSGSGKTTFLNTISGLDKATKGDVFVLGYNLSYLKDSHLTKFRRKHVGFIFQQYNLLTNLTAKENAEVGENLSAYKNPDMTIEDIFETIGMKTQMNKYPHQMSGGQQQRVSIARALAKNPDILFADEPTGALDEEMGRKVLEILVEVNKRYGTTVIVVTHNPNIAKIGNTVIHIRNGKVEEVEANQKPEDPSTIEWA